MAKITVQLLRKGGEEFALINVERGLSKKVPLGDLPENLRREVRRGGGKPVPCTGDASNPSGLQPEGRRQGGNQGPFGAPAHQQHHAGANVAAAGPAFTVEAVSEDSVEFDRSFEERAGPTTTLKIDRLKLTDQVLGARKGAKFQKAGSDWKLSEYAPGIEAGLKSKTPDIDDNPYNFVPWSDAPRAADSPSCATHDRDQENRVSGTVTVTIEARTPVFVPAAGPVQSPKPFFTCVDVSGESRFAIPGSSMKGPVRSVFEALTNSRLGVTDSENLGSPPLYRRRAFRLFEVTNTSPWQAVECAYALVNNAGQSAEAPKTMTQRQLHIDPTHAAPIRTVDYRANLYWVDNTRHHHQRDPLPRKTHVQFQSKGATFDIPTSIVEQFQRMKDHPHIRNHHGNIKDWKRRSSYRDRTQGVAGDAQYFAPPYESVRDQLFDLKVGDLIFAMVKPGESTIACFGRNVNFLWPGAKSPLELIQPLASRAEADVRLNDADVAEATFGFAGKSRQKPKDSADIKSHPFMGRVRFTTFWGPRVEDTENAALSLRLQPLTAPAGTRAKSRPLYLAPGAGGKAADWDEAAQLRGRKFYWHQKADGDGLALQHDANELPLPNGPTSPENVSQNEALQALPRGTKFTGEVHFDNLTSAELGALIASLAPQFVFQKSTIGVAPSQHVTHGLKIGKGKPRGLGSVAATESAVTVLRPATDRYSSFTTWVGNEWGHPENPKIFIDEFKRWLVGGERRETDEQVDQRWKSVPAIKALSNVLALPETESVRVYPPQFDMYGWLPEDSPGSPEAATGGPKQGRRPKAMTPAAGLPYK